MKCFVVLPCYNEGKNIEYLVARINGALKDILPYSVLVINDGSEDGTSHVLGKLGLRYPLEIINHKGNYGIAAALRTGLLVATERASNRDVIVTMDADNTHDPMLIPLMLNKVKEGAGIVIASRYMSGGAQFDVPLHRIILSRAVNLLIGALSGFDIKDVTSGFRCYKTDVLMKTLKKNQGKLVESHGFEASLEILFKASRNCDFMTEVPLVLHYGNKFGKSKMKIFETTLQYAKLLMTKILRQE